jgi:predicted metalloprotease
VDFEDDASLDASQVTDRRGAGGGAAPSGGGGGINAGSVVAAGGIFKLAGGGVVGLIAVVAFLVISGGLGGGTPTQPVVPSAATGSQNLAANCRTGADADTKPECRIVAAVNSTQKYWTSALATGRTPYRNAQTVFFSGRTTTGCGPATAATGPFYCPADETVYLDLGFFDQLRQDFGAQGGPFAESYVIAHEYGHHVQHILGYDARVGRDRQGPASGSVRLELQADCYAGVWARNAVRTGIVKALTQADIDDGLNAASVIGDDRIQAASGGRVTPESFTHGTSAQRQRWLTTGYTTGDPAKCDTWTAASL